MGLSSKQVSNSGEDWAQQSLFQSTSMKEQNQNQPEPPLNCPRCDSMNTKFCYYNNYNQSQPRYYCKSCKRHWTKGGNLRNVPVGGTRRNKRRKLNNCDNSCEENKLFTEIVEDQMQNSFLDSTLALPFSPPNFSFTTFDNFPSSISSPSSVFNGGIQDSDGFDCRGVVECVEDPFSSSSTSSWKFPSSSSYSESLGNWSWDDLNTLVSSDVKQAWEGFEIKEQGI